jgi:hypothetical protein
VTSTGANLNGGYTVKMNLLSNEAIMWTRFAAGALIVFVGSKDVGVRGRAGKGDCKMLQLAYCVRSEGADTESLCIEGCHRERISFRLRGIIL